METFLAHAAARAARRCVAGACAVIPTRLYSNQVLPSNLKHLSTQVSVPLASADASPPTSSTLAPLPYPIPEYKQLVVQAFDSFSRAPDANADPLSDQLARRTMVHAQLSRGNRVLDIASGVGLLLIPAARAVGNIGTVLGLDLSPGMVEQARRNIQTARLRNLEVRQADAEAAELPRASFDVVLCSAALPYMSDPGRALARWHSWLRPSGRLVMNCFQGPYDPECALFYELAASHGLGDVFADPLAGVGSKERLRELLEGAGYRRVQVTEERVDMLAPAASARAYAEAMWESSCSSPHHDLSRLAKAATAATAASSSSSGNPGSASSSPSSSSSGGSERASQTTMSGQRRGQGAAAAAAAAASRASSSPRQHGRGEPPSLGLRPRGGTTSNQDLGLSARQKQQGPASVAAEPAGPGVSSSKGVDPVALATFRESFLAAAERSVQDRLRSGAVRTSIGVLYGIAHAI